MAPKRSKPNPPQEVPAAAVEGVRPHDQSTDDIVVDSAFASRYIAVEVPKDRYADLAGQ